MATQKELTTRIVQKHDTKANWDKATDFIPMAGELLVVTDQGGMFKVGDGVTSAAALPLMNAGPKGDDAVITESDVAGWGFTKNIGTITGIKMNGVSKGSSGVVNLGTVITSHQDIKTLNTNNTTAQSANASEAITGSGTINLHKVAKTGSYNDLLNKPTIPDVSAYAKLGAENTFTETQGIAAGKHLKTNLIKSADNSKYIAEFTSAGLEIGGSGYPLRLYSSTRPVVANLNKELAYISDIPTFTVSGDTLYITTGS